MRFRFVQPRNRTRDDALMWLARLKRGLRQREGPELLAWLKRRSHRTAIARAAVEWHGPEVLSVLAEIFPISPAVLQPRHGRHSVVLAAVALVIACITVLIPVVVVRTELRGRVYTTTSDATGRTTLEDGTRVELNRGTQINVVYWEHTRSVLVARGEAFFNVRSEPDSPFYIHAASRNFETSSATFDVRLAAPDSLTLTVLAGTVTLLPIPNRRKERAFNSRVNRPILLEPLQMLTIEQGQESGQPLTEQDVRSQLSWQRGT
jgi:transmembrane sensor